MFMYRQPRKSAKSKAKPPPTAQAPTPAAPLAITAAPASAPAPPVAPKKKRKQTTSRSNSGSKQRSRSKKSSNPKPTNTPSPNAPPPNPATATPCPNCAQSPHFIHDFHPHQLLQSPPPPYQINYPKYSTPPPVKAYGTPPPAQDLHPLYRKPVALPPKSASAPLPPPKNPLRSPASKATMAVTKLKSASTADLARTIARPVTKPLQDTLDDLGQLTVKGTAYVTQGVAVCDDIAAKLNSVLTSIDSEIFSGNEDELRVLRRKSTEANLRGGWGFASREVSRGVNNAASNAITSGKSTNYFAKVDSYSNSRLPPYLPPLKMYLPHYPIVCLAAQFSQRVYSRPTGKERETHVDADWRMGTKAMVIKSIPVDDMNMVVFAIRGSQTFMDWAVNLNSAPTSPEQFLDDPGNMCHSGFLSVARKMINPVAMRIRALLEEDPTRSSCSLVLTGHSAGGAVASLLYAHMLAQNVRSGLNVLTGCFKRVHCVTFGAPPVSLLPLSKPPVQRYEKSLFLSFVNEGDPVPRADRAYVRSLLDLYSTPAPVNPNTTAIVPAPQNKFKLFKSKTPIPPKVQHVGYDAMGPVWVPPPCTLSTAGVLVVLRKPPNGNEDDVRAAVTSDQQLREVMFGDPMMHMMKLYARRVEVLATKAVTAKSWI